MGPVGQVWVFGRGRWFPRSTVRSNREFCSHACQMRARSSHCLAAGSTSTLRNPSNVSANVKRRGAGRRFG